MSTSCQKRSMTSVTWLVSISISVWILTLRVYCTGLCISKSTYEQRDIKLQAQEPNIFFQFCVLNGHIQKLTVLKFEPSRFISFHDTKSQIFHNLVKFVLCATILNTIISGTVYAIEFSKFHFEAKSCNVHQYAICSFHIQVETVVIKN
jgi:hypothetical protein